MPTGSRSIEIDAPCGAVLEPIMNVVIDREIRHRLGALRGLPDD